MLTNWILILLPLAVLIIISVKNLWLGMLIGSFLLGLLHISIYEIGLIFFNVITDISIMILAIAVTIIPIIGGLMHESGLLNKMVSSLRIKRKTFLVFAPSLLGLLPIPGGAILSCPIITKGGNDIPNLTYLILNIWFRHIFVIIYPLSALLACAKMADIPLYDAVLHLIPAFLFMFLAGYIFFLRKISNKSLNDPNIENYNSKQRLINIYLPIILILTAPVIHFFFMMINIFPIEELALLAGILSSLFLVIYYGNIKLTHVSKTFRKLRPEKFFLLIIFIFFFLKVFEITDIAELIETIRLTTVSIIVLLPFIITIITGRIQVGMSIILPIFFSKYGHEAMSTFTFSTIYFSVFLGYLISPLHPCLTFSIEYFKSNYIAVLKKMLPITFICLAFNLFLFLIFSKLL